MLASAWWLNKPWPDVFISDFETRDCNGVVLKDPFYGVVDYFENRLEVAKAGLVSGADGSGFTLERLKVGVPFGFGL